MAPVSETAKKQFTGIAIITSWGIPEQQNTGLEHLIKNINQKMCEYARNHHISSMGSTAVILKMKGGVGREANIGDSTIFLFRDGKLKK